MEKLLDFGSTIRDALVYAETAPAEFASWPPHECLRRLRLCFGLNRKQLAAKAGVSASLIGRAEKGADVRLSTLRKLYAALGGRLTSTTTGSTGSGRTPAFSLVSDCVSIHFTSRAGGEIHGNAIPSVLNQVE